MPGGRVRTNRGALLVLLLGWLVSSAGLTVWATSGVSAEEGRSKAGRSLFNGKGLCSYCHGIDGHRDHPPRLNPETLALVAKLNPPPSDLRDPSRLRLTNDHERTKIIKEGHEGTGMFPDTTLSDQDIADTLAYLAVLREEALGRHR